MNHAAVILHVDAALLPAVGQVVGWVPLDVLYRLQIFRVHSLQPVRASVRSMNDVMNQSDLLLQSVDYKMCRRADR